MKSMFKLLAAACRAIRVEFRCAEDWLMAKAQPPAPRPKADGGPAVVPTSPTAPQIQAFNEAVKATLYKVTAAPLLKGNPVEFIVRKKLKKGQILKATDGRRLVVKKVKRMNPGANKGFAVPTTVPAMPG